MRNRIEQLVEGLLSEAHPAIKEGGTCEPTVLILHPGGVKSCVICGSRSDRFQWAQIERTINNMLEELDGDVVILLVDIPIEEGASDHSSPRSLESPLPGRDGALKVTIWSSYGFGATGEQRYLRCADGTVLFGKLHWHTPNV